MLASSPNRKTLVSGSERDPASKKWAENREEDAHCPPLASSVLMHRCVSVQRNEHTTRLRTQTDPQISNAVSLFVYVPVGTGHGVNVETTGHKTCKSGFSTPPCGSQELSLGSLHLGGKHLHASPNLRILKSLSTLAQNQRIKDNRVS